MSKSKSESERQGEHERNTRLVKLIQEMNSFLLHAEQEAVSNSIEPKLPTIFVVGAPRCGTTLMMQWLANLNCFAYPTNLLSRFYKAPYIGGLIQKLLTDPAYQYQDELFNLRGREAKFESKLGKTKGALQPNGFWFLWRRFIPNEEIRALTEAEVKRIDTEGLLTAIASIERAFRKPVAMKGKILQYNSKFMSNLLPKSIFIHVNRKLFYNAQSILESREEYYGDIKNWYGGKPPKYEKILDKSPFEQVVEQVRQTNKSIRRELADLADTRVVRVGYEDFCSEPSKIYSNLKKCFMSSKFDLPENYEGPDSFTPTNNIRLESDRREKLEKAISSKKN
jgi:hypothetical protein